MSPFLFLLNLILIPIAEPITPSASSNTNLNILSCVDTFDTFRTSKWKPSVVPKATQNESWYLEGSLPTSTSDVKIQYDGGVPTPVVHSLYLEYMNDSPRRMTIENVRSGGLKLLPGDSSSGWGSEIVDIDGELVITAALRKPQKLFLRKLVLFRKPPVTLSRANIAELLGSKSCQELTKPLLTTAPKQLSSTTSRPAQQCRSKSTQSQATCTQSDSEQCPECKCVCNCNCAKCE